MSGSNKRYGVGFVLLVFGGSGMAECVTSGRGLFIPCAILFAVGFGLILSSYMKL